MGDESSSAPSEVSSPTETRTQSRIRWAMFNSFSQSRGQSIMSHHRMSAQMRYRRYVAMVLEDPQARARSTVGVAG